MVANWSPLKVAVAAPLTTDLTALAQSVETAARGAGCDVVIIQPPRERREWARVRRQIAEADLMIADFTGDITPAVPNADVVAMATYMMESCERPVWVVARTPNDPRPSLFSNAELFAYSQNRRSTAAVSAELTYKLREFVALVCVERGIQPPWGAASQSDDDASATKESTRPVPARAGNGPRRPAPHPGEPAALPAPADAMKPAMRDVPSALPISEPEFRMSIADRVMEFTDVRPNPRGNLPIHGGPLVRTKSFDESAPPTASDPALTPPSLAASPALLREVTAHFGPIRALAVFPDKHLAITGGHDGNLSFWNIKTFDRLGLPIRGHRGAVTDVSFDRTGDRAVSVGVDGAARIWEISGKQVAVGNPIRVHADGARSVNVLPIRSANLRALTGGNDGLIVKWNLTRGEASDRWRGHEGPVTHIALTPNGGRALSGGADAKLILWDVGNGRDIILINRAHEEPITALALSADGDWAISGARDTCKLWNIAAADEISRFEFHDGPVIGAAFLREKRFVVTAGEDGKLGLWSTKSRELVTAFNAHAGAVIGVAVLDHDHLLTAGIDGKLALWDLAATLRE